MCIGEWEKGMKGELSLVGHLLQGSKHHTMKSNYKSLVNSRTSLDIIIYAYFLSLIFLILYQPYHLIGIIHPLPLCYTGRTSMHAHTLLRKVVTKPKPKRLSKTKTARYHTLSVDIYQV